MAAVECALPLCNCCSDLIVSFFPQPLLFSCRPLYSTTMLNLSLCFTGFRDKEEMVGLSLMFH